MQMGTLKKKKKKRGMRGKLHEARSRIQGRGELRIPNDEFVREDGHDGELAVANVRELRQARVLDPRMSDGKKKEIKSKA
jgi:hypothetical protein